MAIRSSIIARAVRKIFSENGTLLPSKVSTPSENAMSVAVGIAQPRIYSVPELKNTKIKAGNITPPAAENTGSSAFLTSESSPFKISLFISRPTRRKKTAIRPSLTQCSSVLEKKSMPAFFCQNAMYDSPMKTLVISREITVNNKRSIPDNFPLSASSFTGNAILLLKNFFKYADSENKLEIQNNESQLNEIKN